MAIKAITDEKLAKFVDNELRLLSENLLQAGRSADQLTNALEQSATNVLNLKHALRSGEFQLPLFTDQPRLDQQ